MTKIVNSVWECGVWYRHNADTPPDWKDKRNVFMNELCETVIYKYEER